MRGWLPLAALVLMAPSLGAQTPAAASDTDRALALAASELAAGRRAEAARLLAAAADRHQSVRALLQLARIQSGDGNAPAALESLRKARALAPSSEEVLSAYAQLSLATRAVVPAILTLRPLTRMCPAVAEYHYLLGVALMQAGDQVAAVESLQRAERLDPNRALTLIALGIALNNRKQFGEARPLLLRGLELEPEHVEATAALAEAEAGLNDLDAAEAHARRVLTKSGDHAAANLVLGMVLIERHRYAAARDALEKSIAAVDAGATLQKAHYQLSLVYARLGDEASSQKHLERYRQALREVEERMKALQSGTAPAASGKRP